ncbi:DUF4129 domain-containing protein [Halovenus rubra]|uniref:DUF4129 domain-containing protein n=2 Tax=Halovenus rubra TaxID=869890 RepID=A0ACC7E7P4_9EURY|nr:DUF4129 domain-containing protein [Halovenus rubra]
MRARRNLLLVFVCIVGILLVAATLPAADPRVDPPGERASGDWENVIETPERAGGESTPETEQTTLGESPTDLDPIVNGTLVPGERAQAGVSKSQLEASGHQRVTMLVDGKRVGAVTPERMASFSVPREAKSVNITVEDTGDSARFQTVTDVQIETRGFRVPGERIDIKGTIGEHNISNAAVLVDGETVTTTDADGKATIELPKTSEDLSLQVKRDILSGNHTVEMPDPEVSFSTPVYFPGAPTHISVSADGKSIQNATVSVGNTTTTTGNGGGTFLRLPVSDEVTVTATVGEEQVTTTVSNLYLRTTLILLVIPGLLLGIVWSYLRFIPEQRHVGRALSELMLVLASLLAGITAAIARTVDSVTAIRLSRISFPSLAKPSLSILTSTDKRSLSFPSFTGLIESVFSTGTSTETSLTETIEDAFSRDEKTDQSEMSETEDETPAVADEETQSPDRQTVLRKHWHMFLDHANVSNRETRTPGEVARYALSAGYPQESVQSLLSLFRDVEYGGTEPSESDVADAQTAVDTLGDYDPEEDSK